MHLPPRVFLEGASLGQLGNKVNAPLVPAALGPTPMTNDRPYDGLGTDEVGKMRHLGISLQTEIRIPCQELIGIVLAEVVPDLSEKTGGLRDHSRAR